MKGFSTQLQANEQLVLGILKAESPLVLLSLPGVELAADNPSGLACLSIFHATSAAAVGLGCVHFWNTCTHFSVHCFLQERLNCGQSRFQGHILLRQWDA